jgi:GT2 family glycosyltransferase
VVDNGSKDESAEYVRAEFPEVNLIALRENRGFTGGNIAGYEQACGGLIILLNNDTEADPHWLEEIHKASRSYATAGAFATKMLFFDERTRIDNCGFALTAAGVTLDLGRGEEDGPGWSEPRKVFAAEHAGRDWFPGPRFLYDL